MSSRESFCACRSDRVLLVADGDADISNDYSNKEDIEYIDNQHHVDDNIDDNNNGYGSDADDNAAADDIDDNNSNDNNSCK